MNTSHSGNCSNFTLIWISNISHFLSDVKFGVTAIWRKPVQLVLYLYELNWGNRGILEGILLHSRNFHAKMLLKVNVQLELLNFQIWDILRLSSRRNEKKGGGHSDESTAKL